MALQERPPSADRQIERLAEVAKWNVNDALDKRGWADQPDLTIRERLAGEFMMNIGQQRRNLDHVAGSQHFEQIAFPFRLRRQAGDTREPDVYGVIRLPFLIDDQAFRNCRIFILARKASNLRTERPASPCNFPKS